jgi:hypothetical protein
MTFCCGKTASGFFAKRSASNGCGHANRVIAHNSEEWLRITAQPLH